MATLFMVLQLPTGFLVENGMNAGMLGSGSYIRTHYFFSERVDAETSGMLDRAPGALPV